METGNSSIISKKWIKIGKAFVLGLFFLSALLVFLRINLWDYDFWWHLASGRYILTEYNLPSQDIFSFTSLVGENKNLFPEREHFILRQYWLAQSIFYILFSNFGAQGIIILRSALLVLTLFLVYRHLQKSGVSIFVALVFLFLLFSISLRSTGERPVLFSILFTAVAISVLEDFRVQRDKKIFFLVPVMLLWSNMHGGFIIGIIILGISLLSEGLKKAFKRSAYTEREWIIFCTSTGIAMAASVLNPNGWDAFFMVTNTKFSIFAKGIQELQSPLYLYLNKLKPVEYNYLVLVALFPFVALLRNKKLDLTHILLLAGFLFMSLKASRYIIFYAIVCIMLLAKELDWVIRTMGEKRMSKKTYAFIQYGLTGLVACAVLIFATHELASGKVEFQKATGVTVPESAVDFIEKNRIEGHIFNEYAYGGYLTWRLYPWKQNFIDSRQLNATVSTEYGWILNSRKTVNKTEPEPMGVPLWERLLDHYHINIIMLSPLSLEGFVPPLLFSLMENEKWVPVYIDRISCVFVRKTGETEQLIGRSRLADELIYNMIIIRATKMAMQRENPEYLVSLGDVFTRTGRFRDAVAAYELAMERLPRWHPAKLRADALRERLNRGDQNDGRP